MKYIILPLCVFLLTGCPDRKIDNQDTILEPIELDYSITGDKQIAWKDILSKGESRYVVYFYSDYCAYCKQVKQEILSFYETKMDEMYFVNAYEQKAIYKNNDGLLIGTKTIENFYIFGTPFLAEITNYTVTNWYAGVDSIRLYISSRIDNKK